MILVLNIPLNPLTCYEGMVFPCCDLYRYIDDGSLLMGVDLPPNLVLQTDWCAYAICKCYEAHIHAICYEELWRTQSDIMTMCIVYDNILITFVIMYL